jgi:hypothetical protein
MTDCRSCVPARGSLVAGAIALLAMGCAPTYSTAGVQAVGVYESGAKEAFSQKYRDLQKSEDERASATSSKAAKASASPVMVLDETVPPGVVIHGDVVSVEDGYPLAIVGRYDFFGPQGGPWTFSDYKSTGRKALCYWQTPLTWVTLGLWALVVPISYPCWTENLTQDERVAQIRLVAMAAGGNLVVTFPHSGGARGLILRASPEYLERLSHGSGHGASPTVPGSPSPSSSAPSPSPSPSPVSGATRL